MEQPLAKRPPSAPQLQFCLGAPALPENLSLRFSSPPPIVVEKLKPPGAPPPWDPGAGDGGSLRFSAVSEESLQRAVRMAKRDLRRRQRERHSHPRLSQEEDPGRGKGPGNVGPARAPETHLKDRRAPKGQAAGTKAKVFLSKPPWGKSDSPPTRDPGPTPAPQKEEEEEEDRCPREVRRLQKELQSYVRKVEELAQKERSERLLDPEEERRAQVWRQEQASRSARMLYVLQQQVKEIQEDLEKLCPHKFRHTKKSRAMARLAAAHRGAVRALQTFVSQFGDRPEQLPAPAHCRELGRLIRQLSLCSTRLEMEPSIPDVVLDLLLQIEDLDSLVAKKDSLQKGPAGQRSLPPQAGPPKGPLRLTRREKASCPLEHRRLPVARKLLPDEHPESHEILARNGGSGECGGGGPDGGWPPPKSEASVEAWARAELEKTTRVAAAGPGVEGALLRRKGAMLLPTRPQGSSRPPRKKGLAQPQARQARFQEPTVSFRLKEMKPPVRESRTPRVAPQPPPPPRLTSPCNAGSRAPFCLSLPAHPQIPCRHPEKSPRSKEASLESEVAEGRQGTLKRKGAPRSDGISPTQMAEKVEQAVRERLEPLLAKAQKVNLSLEKKMGPKGPLWVTQLLPQETQKVADKDALGGDLEDSTLEQLKKAEQMALPALGTSDLEVMLQRMEEIERSEEAVRRRYHQLVYTDIEFCAWEEKRGKSDAAGGLEPGGPPPPIQITRLETPKEPQVDIVLERPSDTNAMEEEMEGGEEEPPQPRGGTGHPSGSQLSPRKGAGTFLSVPQNVLRSISDYGTRYEQHLKRISHEAVGSFNPWHIAQSLAEELAEEALAEVATELQGLCEDYAEAVFTSEFLQAK
ncbi:protein moonraker [Sceloporus undulatus]|uniref:protein moonraker n=1 Tax=Sceloporus undulatus TaxID=8520 RepID=UPI001C4B042F|nr:protein moonraker [Sceloporus undulatus]